MEPQRTLRVGTDLVRVSRIAASLESFGEAFLRRSFTEAEIAYATASPVSTAERLAARFAAKEATVKALGLPEQPRDWREIEVCRLSSGACKIELHGQVRAVAARLGAETFALSLSHDGDYAIATVITTLPSGDG